MIIKSIQLRNFRSYQGFHEINVDTSLDRSKPIVLFGGLNGAGKTSILTAVKLALYGRRSLGRAVSQRAYEEFLEQSIHQNETRQVPADSASVGICFSYGKLGAEVSYDINRSWVRRKKGCEETITVTENGETIRALTVKEAQGFLSQLVPVGVSDLFFFDGEKIADLANDDDGAALGSAIKRLLGIDVVDRLRADLRVFLMTNGATENDHGLTEKIEENSKQLAKLKERISASQASIESAAAELDELSQEQDNLESNLIEIGGDFAASRRDMALKADTLKVEIQVASKLLRENLSSAFPLSLISTSLEEIRENVSHVITRRQDVASNATISFFAEALKKRLEPSESKKVDEELAVHLRQISEPPSFYPEVSTTDHSYLSKLLEIEIPKQKAEVDKGVAEVEKYFQLLSDSALNLERAPDEQLLKEHLEEIQKVIAKVSEKKAEIKITADEIRVMYTQAADRARELRNLYELRSKGQAMEKPIELAVQSREMMLEFSSKRIRNKLDQIQAHFLESFQRLTRKEHAISTVNIDATDFSVTLRSPKGETIDKNKLSAGEKQVYAISMLEALAKTSGNRLPIIIDTPLGRLDSKHRDKLVNEYFPTASHQVLILSTDTEIDESYFASLAPFCSKNIQIDFDQGTSSSSFSSGYFFSDKTWQSA